MYDESLLVYVDERKDGLSLSFTDVDVPERVRVIDF
jgi:hypothetical protein